MADVADVFGFRTLTTIGRGSAIAGLFPTNVILPVPGDSDTGGITGIIKDLIGGIGGLIGGRMPALPQLPPVPGGLPPVFGGAIPPGAIAPGSPGACPSPCCAGQHLDKATGTKCVSNRRMDPLNPKALRRAIRRAKGFERFVKSNRKSLRSLAKI